MKPQLLPRQWISLIVLTLFIAYPFELSFASDDDLEKAGDILQIALPVGAGATTLILRDWQGSWQFAKAFGASWTTTYILKPLYGKMRPNGTARNSFPSGHTMGAFAGAAFFDNRYGHAVGIPAYGLAVLTAYSRVKSNWHFFDDVVAGASVSLLWSWYIVKPYKPKSTSPIEEPRRSGPRFTYLFTFGSAFLARNEITSPTDGGSTFDLNGFRKRDDPTTTASAILEAVLNERHDVILLLNPFEARDNGKFSAPITFQGVSFPADSDIESAWRMTNLRVRWRYNLTPQSRWAVRAGVGLAAFFTTVELASIVENDTLAAGINDFELLPYAHLQIGYQLADKLSIFAEGSGNSLSNDKLFDAILALWWQFNDHWKAGLGYVFYNRDIETSDLTNHVVYNGIGFGVGHAF